MNNQLTVLITCKNEAINIAAAIESVRPLADEILVADSGSTDDTLDIVQRVGGCRVICRDQYIDAANFRNWAIPQASHPWILLVDADERLTEQGREEIRTLLAGNPGKQAYRIGFRSFFLGREIRHCGWSEASSMRLFQRDTCRYNPVGEHADLTVLPEHTGKLEHKILHYTYQSMPQYMEKVRRYSGNVARDWYEAGRTTTLADLWIKPLHQFWYRFCQKKGYLDGLVGFVLCVVSSYYTYRKFAVLRALCRAPRRLSSS
jgi:(heptosyl)LPS beta-1,4-glucosyltransferase